MEEISPSGVYRGRYYISKPHNLVLEYHEGVGGLEDAKLFRSIQANDPFFSPTYNLVADLRCLSIAISMSDIWQYVDFLFASAKTNVVRRIALLTETPHQVAIATLFQQHSRKLPQSVAVVSTVGAALRWVDTDLSYADFERIVSELKR